MEDQEFIPEPARLDAQERQPSAEPSAAGRCEACRHWRFDTADWEYDALRFGECKAIKQREDIDSEACEGVDRWSEEGEAARKAAMAAVKAFAVDGSGYYAAVRTAPDFGCILHEPVPDPATPASPMASGEADATARQLRDETMTTPTSPQHPQSQGKSIVHAPSGDAPVDGRGPRYAPGEAQDQSREGATVNKLTMIAVVAALGVSTSGCGVIYPPWRVYVAEQDGKAQLAEALSSKQVAVQTAKAKWESADFEAKAEVRRAEGVRDANKIIGDGLRGNEEYLRYLYINNLAASHDQIIYVPTEAGLPILEAGKRAAPAAPVKP